MPIFAHRAAARIVVIAALWLAAAPAQEAIHLTEAQKQILRNLEAGSATRAATVLLHLAQAAKSFNSNLLSETPDPEIDRKLSRQMADAFAEVIELRMARIRSAAQALTPQQKSALAAELKKPDSPYLFDDLVRKVLGDPKK